MEDLVYVLENLLPDFQADEQLCMWSFFSGIQQSYMGEEQSLSLFPLFVSTEYTMWIPE